MQDQDPVNNILSGGPESNRFGNEQEANETDLDKSTNPEQISVQHENGTSSDEDGLIFKFDNQTSVPKLSDNPIQVSPVNHENSTSLDKEEQEENETQNNFLSKEHPTLDSLKLSQRFFCSQNVSVKKNDDRKQNIMANIEEEIKLIAIEKSIEQINRQIERMKQDKPKNILEIQKKIQQLNYLLENRRLDPNKKNELYQSLDILNKTLYKYMSIKEKIRELKKKKKSMAGQKTLLFKILFPQEKKHSRTNDLSKIHLLLYPG